MKRSFFLLVLTFALLIAAAVSWTTFAGADAPDLPPNWHVHDCTFQMVYVLNGWATFEYAGHGQKTIRKGDCINQKPGIPHREIACSEDFEVLEIVAPADFKTRVVEAPKARAEAAE